MASEQKKKKKKVPKKVVAEKTTKGTKIKEETGEVIADNQSIHSTEKLTEIKQAYIRWMAMSDTQRCIALEIQPVEDAKKNMRYPKPTHGMFANYYKIGERTLYNWRVEKGFDGAVNKELKAWGEMNVSNVIMALYNNAITKGGAAEVELYLAYFKDWTKKTQIVHKEELTDNDIRNIIATLPEEKQQQFYSMLDEIIATAQSTGAE